MSADTVVRNIVRIDEELCDGCGLCVSPCAEGAITIVDGKARVVREELCDGAGVCLDVCPVGALTIERREALAFDAEAAAVDAPSAGEAAADACSCGNTDADAALLRVRRDGEEEWVCVRCLPALIHG